MPDEIVVAPNNILRQRSLTIKKVTKEVRGIAEEMLDFMDNHSKDDNKPIGLSACQLGHSIRMIAFRKNSVSIDREDIQILLNPELLYAKKQYTTIEGCVSLPGKLYQLRRHKIVKIRGTTLDNTPRSFRGRDLSAQVFEHLLNLLDGIMVDSIGELVKKEGGEDG